MRYELTLLTSLSALIAASPAAGLLGSFAPADGYNLAPSTILGDVTLYNAGAYGPNAGGGPGPTQIAADFGLWKLVSPVGGYFPTTAARNAVVSAGPPYPSNPAGTVAAYIVGNHGPGRTDNDSLALRNSTPAGTGPMVYDYTLDTFDFGGPAPTSVTSGTLITGFYFCPNPGDSPNPGTKVGDKFTLSFIDGSGNVGLEWGYGRDNSVYWRTANTNPWNPTAFIADQTNWDGVKVALDFDNHTFAIDYFDVSANTWTNIAPTGTAMGQSMNEFTTLRWQLEDDLVAGVGGKNFFDDFSVTVPEPTTAGSLAAAGFLLLRRRRSRVGG